jgi:hypothetical protein
LYLDSQSDTQLDARRGTKPDRADRFGAGDSRAMDIDGEQN